MTQKELAIYVRRQLSSGVNPEVLKFVLTSDGWKEQEVEEIIKLGLEQPPPGPSKAEEIQPSRVVPATTAKPAPSAVLEQPANPAQPASSIPAVVAAQTAISSETFQRKPFGKKKWLFVVLAGICLIGGAGYGAYAYFTQTPSYVMNRVVTGMAGVKSFEYSGNVSAEVSGTGPLGFGEAGFPLNREEGKVAGLTTYQANLTFNGRADIEHKRSELTFQADSQGMSLKVNVKALDDASYINVEQFPKIGSFEPDKFLGTWIKITRKTFENFAPAVSEESESLPQDEQRIRAAYNEHPFLVLKDKSREKIGTKAVFRYVYEIDKEELKKYYQNVMEGRENEALERLYQVLDKMQFKEGEVWVGSKDHFIYKFRTALSYKDEEAAVTLTLNLDLGNYNEPGEITAPSSYKNAEQVWQEVMAQSLTSARSKSNDAQRIADIRQLQVALELYYNKFAKYPAQLIDLSRDPKIQYLYAIPTPPPPGEGCNEKQNAYLYRQLQKGSDYSLTFCLGGITGGLEPGVHSASPLGIK